MIQHNLIAAMGLIKNGYIMTEVGHEDKVITFDGKYYVITIGSGRPELFTPAQFMQAFQGSKFQLIEEQ